MSSRRARPPNKAGCKPDGDVCVEHDAPLVCCHACADGVAASKHECVELRRRASETRAEALEVVARIARAALVAAEGKAKSDFAFVKHLVPEMNDLSNAIDALEKSKR